MKLILLTRTKFQHGCCASLLQDLASIEFPVVYWQSSRARIPKAWDSIPFGESDFFFFNVLPCDVKNHIFLLLMNDLRIFNLSLTVNSLGYSSGSKTQSTPIGK